MKKIKLPLLFFISLLIQTAYAGNNVKVQNFINNKNWNFVENKGQLADEKGNILPNIKFYGHQGGVYLYCKPGMISFVFTKTEKEPNDVSEATGLPAAPLAFRTTNNQQPTTISSSRADLLLINSNPYAQIIASDQQEYFENYYTTGNADRGIAKVNTFKKIKYNSIYPHIDLILECLPGNSVEYSFLVHPGGNVNDIKIQWSGNDIAGITNSGELNIKNSLGIIHENAPKSFSCGSEIKTALVHKGNYYQLKPVHYDPNKDLLIDPVLNWSTYIGEKNQTYIKGLETDPATGDVLVTGSTFTVSGLATSGAYKSTNNGYEDAFIFRFDSTGSLKWSTYFGGPATDYGTSLAININGDIFLTGQTASYSGIATSGAYQTSITSPEIALFLAKFNSSGSLSWSTYHGAFNSRFIYGETKNVITDINGDVIICGETSDSGSAATSGAWQTSFGGGNFDAFLVKFKSSGSLQWATYYGGSKEDMPYALSTDSSGNIYMSGFTRSTANIATSGSFQSSYGGGGGAGSYIGDAFLAKFSGSGGLQWGTYFGGVSTDYANALTVDPLGNVYLGGKSSSTGLATSGAYQTSNKSSCAFLAKFNKSGSRIWSTYFGGPNDEANGLSSDAFGNIYMTGIAYGNSNISTSGAYQTSYAGGNPYGGDAFLADFTSTGSLKSSTYFGGSGDEIPIKIKADAFGSVYFAGKTFSTSQIATSGAYQSSIVYGYAGFLTKFAFYYPNDVGIDFIKNPGNIICSGVQTVSVKLHNYGGGILKNASIHWSVDGIAQKTFIWSGTLKQGNAITVAVGKYIFNPGTVSVKAWAEYPNGKSDPIPTNDTANLIIKVNPLPNALAGRDTAICNGASIGIGASSISGNTYSWVSDPAGFTSSLANPVIAPVSTTMYYNTETIKATGCHKTDSVKVKVNALPKAFVGPGRITCAGNPVLIGGTGIAGHSYLWTSKPVGFTDSNSMVSVVPEQSIYYYLIEKDNVTGCTKSDSVLVTVNGLPDAQAGPDQIICPGASAKIGNDPVGGHSYNWKGIPSGFSSIDAGPVVSPLTKTVYYLTETDLSTGCFNMDTVTVSISALPVPGFNVSKACPGDSSGFINTSLRSVSYRWFFGDGDSSHASDPRHVFHISRYYNVKMIATDSTGCSDSVSRKLDISCVWPGDANNDKTVDMLDLMNFGIAYGYKGKPRPSLSILWVGQPSDDWGISFPNGLNYKYTDCNGDSMVNISDTAAISANYSKSHFKSSALVQGSPSDPHFSIKYSNDTFYAGDTLKALIYLGNDTIPVKNIYGLKFSVKANPLLLELDKSWLVLNSSFLGVPNSDFTGIRKFNTADGLTDVGITCLTHKNVSGYGNIATLFIPIKASLPYDYNFTTLNFSNNLQISYTWDTIPLYFTSDSTLIKAHKSGVKGLQGINVCHFKIFPNPFSLSTTIQYHLTNPGNIKIELTDITGKQIALITNEKQIAGDYSTDINAEKYHLEPGMYMLKFEADRQVISKQLLKF